MFREFCQFCHFWTREQAQLQVCQNAEQATNGINRHYRLATQSTKHMVSNKYHKRERQVNQSHASGSDNFNGAEEVANSVILSRVAFDWITMSS